MAFFSRPQSAAVRIVNPTTQDGDLGGKQSSGSIKKDSIQRQCRNIVIYGHCKFQDKGCIYYHPPPPEPPQPPQAQRSDSPITGTLTAQAVNAPIFIPKAVAAAGSNASSPPPMSASRQSSMTSPSPPSPEVQAEYGKFQVNKFYDNYAYQEGDNSVENVTQQMEELDSHYYDETQYGTYPHEFDPRGIDSAYYQAPPVFLRAPLNYHLYTPAMTDDFVGSNVNSHLVPPSAELRQLLQMRSETIRGIAPPGANVPDELQGYHTLVPLDTTSISERRPILNWFSSAYRAIQASDGMPYFLRRIENFRLAHQAAFAAIETWSNIRHPNIVALREAFTTRSFDDNSLVVSYAYHANAETLFDAHFKSKAPAFQPHFQHGRHNHRAIPSIKFIPEPTIWSYIVQIASAIKRVHEHGQAVRMVDVTKVLLTGQNRVRIGSCGVIDVLLYDTPQDMNFLQQEDLNMFGRLIFALCTNNVNATAPGHFQKSLEVISTMYSPDIKNAALFLTTKAGPHRNIDQFLDLIRSRILAEQDEALMATDRLENELLSELENARLVRLLCKFGFINERPEFDREPRWSETGDRYIIKLFRDFVFHQVDEYGNPVLNLSYVLTCLNKLDAGTDEKIMLVARDEQSCIVVSYKDVKTCMEGAFSDLSRAAATRQVAQTGYRG